MQGIGGSRLYQLMSPRHRYPPTLLRSAMLPDRLCGLSTTPTSSSCKTRSSGIFLCVRVEEARLALFQVELVRIASTPAGVVAGLNTDLDSATLDLSRVHLELEDAHARIAALEALLQERDPPEAQVPAMALSPPRKRIRYGEPRSITRLL
jgi:hypothetical protein